MFPQQERMFMVQAVRFVKQALISTGRGWMDAAPEVERIQPDIYAVNEDGDVPEKREFCRQTRDRIQGPAPGAQTRPAKTPQHRAAHRAKPFRQRRLQRWETAMIKNGILNPHMLSLLARVRHTNLLVIADRGFPFWPQIETVDLALVDDIPTVLQVLEAVRSNFSAGRAFMAEEFRSGNTSAVQAHFAAALQGLEMVFEPHTQFKQRVARSGRADPHRRYDPVRQCDPGVKLIASRVR